jgi:methionyl-tRNA formyltransferase
MTRLIYAGTPATAVQPLRTLVADGHEVAAVLTRPDAVLGRKRTLTPSPVAQAAEELGIDLIKASRIDDETHRRLSDVGADLAVVVAYGGLIPPRTLALPAHGWINLHFSLLPLLRGAAPVQWALINGMRSTGATVFQLEEGLDTGPVVAEMTTSIEPEDTAGSLLQRLSDEGARLLSGAVSELAAGAVVPRPQHGEASYAPKLSREDGRIDLDATSQAIHDRIAGVTPEPGAFVRLGEGTLKLGRVDVVSGLEPALPVGALRVEPGKRGRVLAGTADGAIALTQVQPAGKKMMDATAWARGIDTEETVLG